jgi:hypothetical protein
MVGRKLGPVLIGLVSALSRELGLGLQDSLFWRRLVWKPEGYRESAQASSSEEERPRSQAHSRAFCPSDRVDELSPGATRPADNCLFGTDKLSVHKVYIYGALLLQHQEIFSMLSKNRVMILPCR